MKSGKKKCQIILPKKKSPKFVNQLKSLRKDNHYNLKKRQKVKNRKPEISLKKNSKSQTMKMIFTLRRRRRKNQRTEVSNRLKQN